MTTKPAESERGFSAELDRSAQAWAAALQSLRDAVRRVRSVKSDLAERTTDTLTASRRQPGDARWALVPFYAGDWVRRPRTVPEQRADTYVYNLDPRGGLTAVVPDDPQDAYGYPVQPPLIAKPRVVAVRLPAEPVAAPRGVVWRSGRDSGAKSFLLAQPIRDAVAQPVRDAGPTAIRDDSWRRSQQPVIRRLSAQRVRVHELADVPDAAWRASRSSSRGRRSREPLLIALAPGDAPMADADADLAADAADRFYPDQDLLDLDSFQPGIADRLRHRIAYPEPYAASIKKGGRMPAVAVTRERARRVAGTRRTRSGGGRGRSNVHS